MNFNIGDHLQVVDDLYNGKSVDGYVAEISLARKQVHKQLFSKYTGTRSEENWYLLENNELGLSNHWVPESKLKLHKQTIRENKLNQLGIK